MQLHNLKPTKKKRKKVVGRGGAHGTYSARGMNGQKARSGGGKGRSFAGDKTPLFRRTPKLRGFKSLYAKNNITNVSALEASFESGEVITPRELLKKGLISKIKPRVKILGNGELSKKFVIEGCVVSKSAEEKIGKVGGEVKSM